MNAPRVATIAPSPTQPAVVDGMEVLQWLEHAFPIMHDSEWGPLLEDDGIDVLDAAIGPLYLSTINFLRRDRSQDQRPSSGMIGRARQQVKLLGFRAKRFLEDRATSRRSAPLEHADILFWPCEPTHVKAMLPVLRWLNEQHISSTVFACRAKVFHELEAHGIGAVFPNAYWNKPLRQAKRIGRKQRAALRTVEPFDFHALRPLDDTVALVNMLQSGTANLLPDLYETKVNCQEILRNISPRVIVVGNDITFQGRIACRMAKAAGIPTACPMHGSLASNPLHALHIVERYLAYGENAKRILTDLGFPGPRVVVCGAPYLDRCPKQTGQINETIRHKLQLDDAKPYVLVATSGPGHTVSHKHHTQVIEAICRASLRLPHVQLVAKLHRKDRVEYYNQVLSRVPDAKLHVVPYGTEGYPGDIFDWLQGSAALLTGASTVAIEAMLMDVAVVTMDLADEFGETDFIACGATTHITKPEALVEAVQAIVKLPDKEATTRDVSHAYLHDMFLHRDGHSAQRVGQELCHLANLSNP